MLFNSLSSSLPTNFNFPPLHLYDHPKKCSYNKKEEKKKKMLLKKKLLISPSTYKILPKRNKL